MLIYGYFVVTINNAQISLIRPTGAQTNGEHGEPAEAWCLVPVRERQVRLGLVESWADGSGSSHCPKIYLN